MHPASTPVDRTPDASVAASPAYRPRLLLIERDEAVQFSLTKALTAYHKVQIVPDSLAAVFAAQREPPDLVIIDLYLPGTDNLSLIRSMRADARTTSIPIIVLSTPTNREILLLCLSAGASNFLLKPFNVAELLMCVRVELHLRTPSTDLFSNSPALTCS